MSNVKELSQHLKVLEIFSLQFFSISKLNFKSKKLKSTSKNYLIYLVLCPIPVLIIISYSTYTNFLNFSYSSENYLGKVFRFFGHVASIFRLFSEVFESLFKVSQNQEFFMLFEEFCEFILKEFKLKICLKFLKKFLFLRLIFVFSSSIFVSFVILLNEFNYFDSVFYFNFFTIFFDLTFASLIIFKFCFYVDLICISLMKINESFNQIPLFSHNKQLMLNKIYKIKRSYIYVIELTDLLNSFMAVTIFSVQLSQMMWILDTFYFLINVISVNNKFNFLIGFGEY